MHGEYAVVVLGGGPAGIAAADIDVGALQAMLERNGVYLECDVP